jgi:poly(A) polymerase
MKLPDAAWRERPGMSALLDALDAAAGMTRFVGGCVRDTLLELEVADVDLATRLRPEAVIARLEEAGIKAIPTGLAHGTVTAVNAGQPVEITTLRRDVATDGRRATIAFTEDWREDAARRDFTINALSADPVSGALFDYFDGAADLADRRVRFIGDPYTRIAEDRLRILRFFRFHARFGSGAPDEVGLAACAARANDLMALSRERIGGELLRLLALPEPGATIALMIGHAILRPVLPEIEDAARLSALIEREREAGDGGNPIRRLAALLPQEPRVAEAVAARLRLSNKQAQRLVSAATPELLAPHSLAYRIGVEAAIDRMLLQGGDAAAIRSLRGWRRPHFALSGGDLIAAGLSPGPIVARTLRAIEQEWVESGFVGGDALRDIQRRHVDQALRSSQ